MDPALKANVQAADQGLVMIRTLITFAILRRLRTRSPELFDGARALAAIQACIEQDGTDVAGQPGYPGLA
ncbi:MAG: hypothetical protein ABI323_05090 [Solirubrobacteraceae bacterium]